METSSEEKNIQDILPLTNILPTITGFVRSRSESSINDDDSDSHIDFSLDDFKYIDDGDSDHETNDLERRSRRTNQRRSQRALESAEQQRQRQETDRTAHENQRALRLRNNDDGVKKLIG